ncbi:polymorphic toxin-type HINT domain-containing protein [Streptomyces sp. NPDC051018]|uniref:polymorphic toxin-type HINT domain-containing protein n=1 Tax=Streptomyces sp. NPDC051018 TaxID=3365639 RepID=UPI00379EFCA5
MGVSTTKRGAVAVVVRPPEIAGQPLVLLEESEPGVGPVPGAVHLTWDDQGHLETVTQGTKTSEYRYDTEGQRLIRKDSTGTTLYLPGGNELHTDNADLTTGTRYYSAGGKNTAMRTGGTLTFLLTDHHNTATTQITADAAQTVTRRKTNIFGAPRGPQPTTWKGDRSFVGGIKDTDTGLTHLGAREYDPNIARFISVDPLLQVDIPQTLNGYSYGAQNPLINPDPSGLGVPECHSGALDRCRNGVPTKDSTYHPERERDNCTSNCYDGPEATGDSSVTKQRGGKSWMGKATDAFVKKAVDFGSGMMDSTVQPFKDIRSCITLEGKCEEALAGVQKMYNPLTAVPDMAKGAYAEASEIYGDFSNGRTAEGSGKLAFSAVIAIISKRVIAAKAKPKGKCSSFIPGTLVVMADGKTKPIEEIEIGDKVLATNPQTGKTTVKEVTDTILSQGNKNLVKITLKKEKTPKVASVTATDNHPFWVPELRKWIDATDLQPGQWLRTSSGTHIQITAVKRWPQNATVHNLTVADIHTYYVLAGATPVLVHNSNGLCGTAALENGDWQHIVDRHRPGGAKVDDKAGILTGKAKHVRGRIAETINRGTPRPNTPDPETGRPRAGQIYEWDFGVPVGRAGPANGGGELTSIRVIVNDGKVVTAFPF